MFGRSGFTEKDRKTLELIEQQQVILLASMGGLLRASKQLVEDASQTLALAQKILAQVSNTPGPVVSLRVQLGRAVNQ